MQDKPDHNRDSALKEARRGVTPLLFVAAAVLVLGAIFYFGLAG